MTDDRMETITDPAEIRATDEPDERGDFPCCTTPAPASGAGLGVCGYALTDSEGDEYPCDATATGYRWYQDVEHEDLLDVACEFHRNAGGDRMAALVAEVRQLTVEAATQREWFEAADAAADRRLDQSIAWMERAESAEAEVGTLRARLAEAEALHWKVGGACSHCSQRSDYAVAWPCETAVALAGTTGEGQ